MAIYAPGIRRGRQLVNTKRNVVAVLQLTAMVDMFTVLVVFLLQNYAVTDQILPISEKIRLPEATQVRELKPSYVVTYSNGNIILNSKNLGSLNEQTSQTNWVFSPLKETVEQLIQRAEGGNMSSFLASQLKRINLGKKEEDFVKKTPFRVTIQADETDDFLAIKKIMFTLTEAGIKEMNFAVIKNRPQK